MYRIISEKIFARGRRANMRMSPTRPSAALLIALLSCVTGTGLARPAFERATFSKIEFSGPCAQKQWSLMPDDTLELLLTPGEFAESVPVGQPVSPKNLQSSPHSGPCEAILEFYF